MPDKNYIIYQCKECGCVFIIPKEFVDRDKNYLTCPKHGRHHQVIVIGAYDSLAECINDRKYKRNERGALEQYG